ncbi:serine/threonine-protein kinase [Nonomuraea sp. MCN248]|uniref:Serine/threonine-protein kinase n=1 Tax=Nonomuraea corallina TaxID=2989783 RepID=A0ABT4SF62_9ACTN|nr:serine/threonine-protein kinase [Nonomuraea corallina]MDA0635822.1 serine/threonine-protein kinase [Nonomuraea corallina]
MSTQTQEQLGPYRLIRKIGEGGMGTVHLGLDGAGREVAVKELHQHVRADLKAGDRLSREVDAMRRVRSRHVAQLIDAELAGQRPYVVTQFAPGRTLEDTVLTRGPLEAREVARLAVGLCRALVDIHAAGVIHRDLKPSNVIMVDGQPLVIDFGIAHLVDAVRLTRTGMFVGTPGYLAPEIIRGTRITQAADVHALASTVFFAATGQPPFGTGPFEAVCYNTMEGRARLDLAPAWLRGWLARAMEIDPAARPGARELLRTAEALNPAAAPRPDRTLTLNTVSDLLPPVQYAPAPAHPPTRHLDQPRDQPRDRSRGDNPSPSQPFDLRRFLAGSDFVGVLALVTLMSVTIINPVTAGLAVAALALGLRAADHFLGPDRRTPARAALVALGHTLLALALGMTAAILLHRVGPLSASDVDSLAAGAFTLGLFVLPGAGPVRRSASRALARLLPGHRAIVVSSAVMGPIALISLIAVWLPR